MIAAWHFTILDEPARLLHPEYLWLVAGVLVACVLLGWATWRRITRIHAVVPERLAGRVMPGFSRTRPLVRLALSGAGLVFLSLALTQPQFGTGTERIAREGIDLVVVLDASRSMLAGDVAPTRFDRARLELSTLLDELHGDRFGLVAFAGTPIVQVPMTTDHRAARMYLRALHPDHMPRQGTNIGGALRTAHRMLNERGASRSQVVLLISDGEDHHRDARETAERLAADGIVIFTIGIGSGEGDLVPATDASGNVRGFHRDRSGNNVLSRVDETLLRDIAAIGGGRYVNTHGRGIGVSEVLTAVREMEQDEHEVREIVRYEDQSTWLLFPGFVLLLGGALLRPGRARPTPEARAAKAHRPDPGPAARAALLLLAAGLGWGVPSSAEARRLLESEHPRIVEGNRAYAEGRYDEALAAYESMLDEELDPEQQAVVHYNRGTAHAAKGDVESARKAFDASIALGGPKMQARDYYNLGTALLNDGDFEGARDALTESLRRDPGNRAAQHNLELALRALQDPPPPSDMGSDDRDDENGGDDDPEDGEDDPQQSDPDDGEDDSDDADDGDRDEDGEGEGDEDPEHDPEGDETGEDDRADEGEDDPDDGGPEDGDSEGDEDDGDEDGDRGDEEGEEDPQDGDETEDDRGEPDRPDTGEDQADAQADPGAVQEDGDEEEGAASGPVEIDEQDVDRILDALEARENPMQPFLFRPPTELEQYTEEDQDW